MFIMEEEQNLNVNFGSNEHKLSKKQRRVVQKQLKLQKTLARHDNIICSESATKVRANYSELVTVCHCRGMGSHPFRSRSNLLPGANQQLRPWPIHSVELSLPGPFTLWNFRSSERNGPGTSVPWNFCSQEYSLLGMFPP